MPKLLMITGLGSAKDLASGKKGAFYNTLEEFHKYWDRIDIVAPKTDRESGTKEFFGNVYVHISPLPLIFHPFYFVWKSVQLNRMNKFDLMTIQDFPPFYNGIGAMFIHGITKVPYVLEIMHIPGLPRAADFKEKIYRWFAYAFIDFDSARAKAVRVINKKEVPEFLIKAGIAQKKIVYIPANYIDLEIFKPMPEEVKKYDLIFVGRLEQNKGIELLLKAIEFSIFNFQFPMKCLIVGDGPLKEDLKLKILNLKLDNFVVLYGWAKDSTEIAQLMNQAKILVMTSYNEGGPRVILEAMACGLSVLATPVGIVHDVIKDDQTGYIIDWDSEDIAVKANKLLEGDKYKELSANCISSVRPFERQTAIKNYADKLKELL